MMEIAGGGSPAPASGAGRGGRAWAEAARAVLAAEGYRSGGARTAVVEALAGQETCLSPGEIVAAIPAGDRRVAVASVYRALDLLVELGLVSRLGLGPGAVRYEIRGPVHTHHLVCGSCGEVTTFVDSSLDRAVARIARGMGYRPEGQVVARNSTWGECEPPAARRPPPSAPRRAS